MDILIKNILILEAYFYVKIYTNYKNQNRIQIMNKKVFILILLVTTTFAHTMAQQASITIMNKSDRFLTVKIIKGGLKKGTLYKTTTIAPQGKETAYFDQTGHYFIKNQAILVAKDTNENDTIYSKGNLFEIISDPRRGFSHVTMKFTVKESKHPITEGNTAITRKEYEND
jgi:hypothetical protein